MGRVKTDYPGVYYRLVDRIGGKGKEKVFYVTFKRDGKTIETKVGRQYADDMTAAKASRVRGQLIEGGVKTRKETREFEAAQKKVSATLAEAWPEYLEAKKARWSPRYLLDHQRMIDPGGRLAIRAGKGERIKPGALAALGAKKLTDINTEVVKRWLKAEAATRPTQARYAFGILKAFLNWASEHPDFKDMVDPGACGRRIKRDVLPPKKAKDDCLQKEMLKPWFAEVRKLDPVISAYLQGLLLTGARRNELAPLKWDDVDFQWKSLTIHDKVDGERTIPLPPYLAALLYPLPRRNAFVFSSPRKNARLGYITEPRRAHNRACETAGIGGLTIHGLRRSFGTLSEWIEAPTGVVAQIMGHKPSALAEKHYRRRPLDLLRLWHTKIEGWILEQAGIAQPDENADVGKLRVVK
ncbi:MAG: site-specific integrase [Desulfosarcinaceae bacterium]|jgi:integrase